MLYRINDLPILTSKLQCCDIMPDVKQTIIKCLKIASVIGVVGVLVGLLLGWKEFDERGIAEYGTYQNMVRDRVYYEIFPDNKQAYDLYREQTKDDLTLYLAKGAMREFGVVQICLGMAFTVDYYRCYLIRLSDLKLFAGYLMCAGMVIASNYLLDKSLQQLLGLRYK